VKTKVLSQCKKKEKKKKKKRLRIVEVNVSNSFILRLYPIKSEITLILNRKGPKGLLCDS